MTAEESPFVHVFAKLQAFTTFTNLLNSRLLHQIRPGLVTFKGKLILININCPLVILVTVIYVMKNHGRYLIYPLGMGRLDAIA